MARPPFFSGVPVAFGRPQENGGNGLHGCLTPGAGIVFWHASQMPWLCAATVNRRRKVMPAWTRKAIEKIWQQVLEDVEATNANTKSIMWKNTDFLRHVVNEKEEERLRFTHVSEHCKPPPVEDFLWWESTDHGEEKKKTA